MGVQRAKPIDLSAGNEPFHINGGRGGRMNAGQVFLLHVWVCGRLLDLGSEVSLTLHTRQLITAVRQRFVGVSGAGIEYRCRRNQSWQLAQTFYLKQPICRFDLPFSPAHTCENTLPAFIIFGRV